MKVTINNLLVQNEVQNDNAWLVVDKRTNLAVAALRTRAKAREIAQIHGEYTQSECKVIALKDAEIELAIEQPKPVIRADINRESTIIRPCKRVWAIADMFPGKKRKEIIALCIDEGIAYNTARTQYQQWFEIQKEMKGTRSATN